MRNIQRTNSNGFLGQGFLTFCGLGGLGVAKELRAPPSPPPTHPVVGGWDRTAGAPFRPPPGAGSAPACLQEALLGLVHRRTPVFKREAEVPCGSTPKAIPREPHEITHSAGLSHFFRGTSVAPRGGVSYSLTEVISLVFGPSLKAPRRELGPF